MESWPQGAPRRAVAVRLQVSQRLAAPLVARAVALPPGLAPLATRRAADAEEAADAVLSGRPRRAALELQPLRLRARRVQVELQALQRGPPARAAVRRWAVQRTWPSRL
jgi:hypothetical protein